MTFRENPLLHPQAPSQPRNQKPIPQRGHPLMEHCQRVSPQRLHPSPPGSLHMPRNLPRVPMPPRRPGGPPGQDWRTPPSRMRTPHPGQRQPPRPPTPPPCTSLCPHRRPSPCSPSPPPKLTGASIPSRPSPAPSMQLPPSMHSPSKHPLPIATRPKVLRPSNLALNVHALPFKEKDVATFILTPTWWVLARFPQHYHDIK